MTVLGLTLWWGPNAALVALGGSLGVYSQQTSYFSETAAFTFGGADSLLGCAAHEADRCPLSHELARRTEAEGFWEGPTAGGEKTGENG